MRRPRRIEPGPGQESVWDYPRPPRLEPVTQRLRVELGGRRIADTTTGFRVLETSHPPTYYLPPDAVSEGVLQPSPRQSVCEWKGVAVYHHVVVASRRVDDAAWSYPDPNPAFAAPRDHVAFYAQAMDGCWVDNEMVTPVEGDFYGGWITSGIVGPFRGGPGTWG